MFRQTDRQVDIRHGGAEGVCLDTQTDRQTDRQQVDITERRCGRGVFRQIDRQTGRY